MHEAVERTLYETLPASIYIPVGNSWVYLANDSENNELIVADIPASLTEEDIKLRVRMAHLNPKAESTYRNTLKVLELTLQGKHAKEISDIINLPVEKVRKLRNGMRETVSNTEKKIDEFIANPQGSTKKQKSVSVSAQHSSKSKVEPYRNTVVALRKEGKGHMAIYDEICGLGFAGSHSTVDNYIIKLERENSIDKEIADKRRESMDYYGSFPERPEKISVRVYSAKTVYKKVLAKIKECRDANNDEKTNNPDNESPEVSSVKKKQRNPVE